jgi:regulator of RNase E activity RraA
MSESEARTRRSLTEEELEAWKRIPTAVLSDERGHTGVMTGIRPRFEGRAFAGQALTIEVRSVEDTPPREILERVASGACIVIDARVTPDAAVWGGNLIRIARERGVVGIVVDGCVRDLAELRTSGLAVCSRDVTPRGPTWGGRVGATIRCGDVDVRAGDLIVGDDDGVVCVPLEEATEALLGRCVGRLAREANEQVKAP